MLAAFAYWAELNIKEGDAGKEERIQAICSRIRFPDIPASVLLNYHAHYPFMRWFDPDKELLMRAVRSPYSASSPKPAQSHQLLRHGCSQPVVPQTATCMQIASAAEPEMRNIWGSAVTEVDNLADNDAEKATAGAIKAKMERWWLPRVPQLGAHPAPASLQFEARLSCFLRAHG